MTTTQAQEDNKKARGQFGSRRVFIFAAIGSAVGLGNIWRFPYVAYENGGGSFMIPYLVALMVAGIPFLYLDYAMGFTFRGSAPLSFARLKRRAEAIGWWQVAVCFLIAVYYAAVIAWAVRYTGFSFTEAWGDDPDTFFSSDFLQAETGVTFNLVPGVWIPLLAVWVLTIVILLLGVQNGVGRTSAIFIPVLFVAFTILVVQSLFFDGAADGLNALFSPNWSALLEPGVWGAAFGQIFFSLSIGFGVMITYASYIHRKTDVTGSGQVVAFSNSGFELLAGIGVFSALGFLAQASSQPVEDVASGGVGLAFVVFPTIISEAPGGAFLGVLFFASLVLAGITSLISILEVIISAVRDKFELSRVKATWLVSGPCAVISLLFFSTSSGINALDILDHFVNQFGILLVAVVSTIVIAWGVRALPRLADELNRTGSVKLGAWWRIAVGIIIPLVLGAILIDTAIQDIRHPYGEGAYPQWMLWVFGWGCMIAAIVFAVLAARLPWKQGTPIEDFDVEKEEENWS